MNARMIIQAQEVPRIHMLMEEEERVSAYLDSMPEDHPELKEWIARYDALMEEILKERKKDWGWV